jgi:hypothetical protein
VPARQLVCPDRLFDHLVGAVKERDRESKADRLGVKQATKAIPIVFRGAGSRRRAAAPNGARPRVLGREDAYLVSNRIRKARKPLMSLKPCGTPGGT